MTRFAIVCVLCSLASAAVPQTQQSPKPAQSQPLIEAPKVQPEQQADDPARPMQTPRPESNATLEPRIVAEDSASKKPVGEHLSKAQEDNELGTEYWPPIWGYRLKVTDTLVALFTALLFFATIALFWATYRLVSGADNTAKRQLRAYVGKSNTSFVCLAVGSQIEVRIVVRNFGATPAYDFDTRLYISAWYQSDHIELPIAFDDEVRPDISLMPGAESVTVCSVPLSWDESNLSAMRNGTFRVRLFGSIVYKDAFGDSHYSHVNMLAIGQRAFTNSAFISQPGSTDT